MNISPLINLSSRKSKVKVSHLAAAKSMIKLGKGNFKVIFFEKYWTTLYRLLIKK
jgi:hypothetical protein